MKLVGGREIREYVYESEEERNKHIKKMSLYGWMEGGPRKRLKNEGDKRCEVTEDDYEWYAYFQRYLEV